MTAPIAGLFDSYDDAQAAVNGLLSAGFRRADVGIAANNAGNQFAYASTEDVQSTDYNVSKGVAGGAAEGAAFGGVAGLAAGLATLLVPGVGPIFAVGILAATLSGAGLGAVGGGIIGGLASLGIPEELAHSYSEGLRRGGTLVTVRDVSDEQRKVAKELLSRHGAVDIEQRHRAYASEGFSGYRADAPHWTADQINQESAHRNNNFATLTANATPLDSVSIHANSYALDDPDELIYEDEIAGGGEFSTTGAVLSGRS